jgi:hypothetical protein
MKMDQIVIRVSSFYIRVEEKSQVTSQMSPLTSQMSHVTSHINWGSRDRISENRNYFFHEGETIQTIVREIEARVFQKVESI